ncbi:hypothetical protein CVT25_015346 [Psilocybe cyanescens]|uniref:Uncharacterized protein n=1 Tax=Psilocybe cyanescens TaxID=93625 RepID=A0A409WH63_PSICY|nr:hypothetical protein CVT25_015346 [Psilocybe cyanescens]
MDCMVCFETIGEHALSLTCVWSPQHIRKVFIAQVADHPSTSRTSRRASTSGTAITKSKRKELKDQQKLLDETIEFSNRQGEKAAEYKEKWRDAKASLKYAYQTERAQKRRIQELETLERERKSYNDPGDLCGGETLLHDIKGDWGSIKNTKQLQQILGCQPTQTNPGFAEEP